MSKIKLLIAEDDESTLALYDKGLSKDMFEKRFAMNGQDALDIYHAWKPDIVVLDIVMPVMTGYSVLQEIRENAGDNKTTIIMASSMSTKDDMRDCSKLGIQGYITKPFKFKEIGNIIINCFQNPNPLSV
jgi:DNA-binding response OmpR family regulator